MPNEGKWIASFQEKGHGDGTRGLSDLDALQLRKDLRLMPLQLNARALLEDLPDLGSVAYTTGNACASCTRREQVTTVLPMGEGTALFGDHDGMRWLNASWRHSVAVLSQGPDFTETPPCLLLFGETGELAHQITLSDPAAWEGFIELVCRHRGCWNCLRNRKAPSPRVPVDECPAWMLREAWCEAGSDQDLDSRLARLGLPRLLALRAMEGLYTTSLEVQDLAAMLEELVATRLSVHIQLGNRHCTEVLESPLERLVIAPETWEIQMSQSTLRLDPSRMESIWFVVQPWLEKEQHRFECYDAAGERVLVLSCPHSPGPAVELDWQRMIGRFEARVPA